MKAAPPIFQVGHLERVPLGTPYPGIVAHVGRLLGKLPAGTELVIDITGVGKPVFEMFTYAGISPVGVFITAGMTETRDGAICGVPKLTLVSRLQALLHEGRLKILRELAEADTLVRELQDFRVEFSAAGHLTFNARSGKHDDLVLALAVAFSGVGPIAARLPQTESFLVGQLFSESTFRQAGKRARAEVEPISDVRGSSQYRLQLAENILLKFHHEVAGAARQEAAVGE
jgi:hypothetical protein